MKVQYYKSNHGIFFSIESAYSSYYGLNQYTVNGIEGSAIPKYGSYYLVDSDQLVFQKKVSPSKVQVGWKLKNKELESRILPLDLQVNDILEPTDEEDRSGPYDEYSALYERVFKEFPAALVDVEVQLVYLGELQIDNLSRPEETKVKVVSGNFGGQAQILDLSSIVSYDDLTKMLVPDFMLHNHPCSLASQQVYAIIRSYVKDNINTKTAKISSDYDFCFTVQKVLTTAKPIKVSKEVFKPNGGRYATPRFKTVEASTKMQQIFEMTHSGPGGKHSGYTVIEGWKADSLEDMKQQVKVYLESLMQVINAESKECSCCCGTGFVFETCQTK